MGQVARVTYRIEEDGAIGNAISDVSLRCKDVMHDFGLPEIWDVTCGPSQDVISYC